MADVKALVDFTVEQTSVAVGDLLYVASAGTPAKVTFANLVDNDYTYSSTMTFSGTMTATGTIDVSGGTLTFGGTQDFVPKADASGNLVDGFGIETTLTDDDTKLATSGGVFDMFERGGTALTTTGVSAYEFTAIPAGVQEITLKIAGASLSGSDNMLGQLGTSGGFVTSGYAGAGAITNSGSLSTNNSSAGALLFIDNASRTFSGFVVFKRMAPGSNLWAYTITGGSTAGAQVYWGGGHIDLGGECDRVRLTRTGSNTFDSIVSINAEWR